MSLAGSKRSTFTAPVKLVTRNVNLLIARPPRVLELLGEGAPDRAPLVAALTTP